MKLPPQHILPYATYGVQLTAGSHPESKERTMQWDSDILMREVASGDRKMKLRHLSGLVKGIGVEIDLAPSGALHNESPYYIFQYCFEHGFDCFGLLDNKLAERTT